MKNKNKKISPADILDIPLKDLDIIVSNNKYYICLPDLIPLLFKVKDFTNNLSYLRHTKISDN